MAARALCAAAAAAVAAAASAPAAAAPADAWRAPPPAVAAAPPIRSVNAAGGLRETYSLIMPDGVALSTDVDFPPFFPADKKSPAIMERSPYGHTDIELIALVFAEALGYVSVRQDMRGTGDSGGQFGIWHDSAGDAYATMEWLRTNQTGWFRGEVFTTGASADCIDEFAQIAHPHPALRGQLDVFCTMKGWETFLVGGAFRQALIEGWLHMTVPGDYAQDLALIKSQEQPGTPWWQPVNGTPWYGNVNWPSVQ
jgi:predicted acyl esterase